MENLKHSIWSKYDGFFRLPRRINRNMSWQADGKQSAFHEMMHAYRAYQETTASYKESTLNGEIEAWYAQYLYTSNLPEYKDSKWEDRDNTDPRRRRIKV